MPAACTDMQYSEQNLLAGAAVMVVVTQVALDLSRKQSTSKISLLRLTGLSAQYTLPIVLPAAPALHAWQAVPMLLAQASALPLLRWLAHCQPRASCAGLELLHLGLVCKARCNRQGLGGAQRMVK